MKFRKQHTPDHDHHTRLAQAFRNTINGATQNAHNQAHQNTHGKNTATLATVENTYAPQQTPVMAHNGANNGDITQVNIEKFNGLNGLSVGDFIRNVEADGKAKGLVGNAFDKHCVSLARNRIDLTKSNRVQHVTRLIDVQPEAAKDWAFVKEILQASFGEDCEKPEYKFGTLLKAKPDDNTTAGIATYITNIRARWQEWVKTNTPAELTASANADRETIARINQFLAVSFLSTLVPENRRKNAVDILRETNWDNLAHKTSELLSIPAMVPSFAAQDTTVTARQMSPAAPRFQGQRSPRGGARRGGLINNRSTNKTENNRPGSAYWPTRDQCQRCARPGHWARGCTAQPFCTFHNREGHSIVDCIAFKSAFPSFFVQNMDTTTWDYAGREMTDQL